MDKHYGKEALQKSNKIKSELHLYIHRGFYIYYSKIASKDTKLMNSNELEKQEKKYTSTRLAYEELKNNPKYSTDINELKEYCSQDKIRNYLKEYSDDLSLKLFSSIDESKNILDDFVLPLSILDIEMDENNSRIIYNLKYNKLAGPINYYLYRETFYQKFLMKRKELEFPKLNNYKNEIINLINDDNFLQELSYKIPALTGPSMKIFINPILDFSVHPKKEISQRKDNLCLFIILQKKNINALSKEIIKLLLF